MWTIADILCYRANITSSYNRIILSYLNLDFVSSFMTFLSFVRLLIKRFSSFIFGIKKKQTKKTTIKNILQNIDCMSETAFGSSKENFKIKIEYLFPKQKMVL